MHQFDRSNYNVCCRQQTTPHLIYQMQLLLNMASNILLACQLKIIK